jgi:hypothetical protein
VVAEQDELAQAKVRKRNLRSWKLSSVKRWRELGFLVLPKHDREGESALAARNFIDSLPKMREIRNMIALGRGTNDIVRYIQQECSQRAEKYVPVTLRNYVAFYRRFFISPLDALRASVGNEALHNVPQQMAISTRDRILGATEKVKEVGVLEKILDMQLERLEAAGKNEKENLGGFLMQGFHKEIEIAVKTARELVDLKSELGYGGYLRIPRVIDINARVQAPDIGQLSDVERASIKEFSDQFLEMIKLSASEDELSASEDGVFQVNGPDGNAN